MLLLRRYADYLVYSKITFVIYTCAVNVTFSGISVVTRGDSADAKRIFPFISLV